MCIRFLWASLAHHDNTTTITLIARDSLKRYAIIIMHNKEYLYTCACQVVKSVTYACHKVEMPLITMKVPFSFKNECHYIHLPTCMIINNIPCYYWLIKLLTIIFIMNISCNHLLIDLLILQSSSNKSIVSLCSLIFHAITIINGKVTSRAFYVFLVPMEEKHRRYTLLFIPLILDASYNAIWFIHKMACLICVNCQGISYSYWSN